MELDKWKDVLNNCWKGPDPIIMRARGAVCVLPQDQDNPFWVPERLIRTVKDVENMQSIDDAAVADSSNAEPDGAMMGDSICIPEANAR